MRNYCIPSLALSPWGTKVTTASHQCEPIMATLGTRAVREEAERKDAKRKGRPTRTPFSNVKSRLPSKERDYAEWRLGCVSLLFRLGCNPFWKHCQEPLLRGGATGSNMAHRDCSRVVSLRNMLLIFFFSTGFKKYVRMNL